ncbi:MAG: mitomycin radical oxidase [Microbacteriaceae bacterium]|nr:mitomycin radical oxidase [Microbacteriaceae bacterium]
MLATSRVTELKERVSGPVLIPLDPDFGEEVFAFNVAVAHQPDVVVGAANARDVVEAVKWAAAEGMGVAVQATGHGATEPIIGGLLITTRRMQDVEIDEEARTARVGAGVKWKTLLAASVPHGLFGLNGSSSDVGIVGYTLGGGFPVLGRAHGFAADHVRSFEAVDADGMLRHVDPENDPELFSLMRGGKGNFAIVTSLSFDLLPIGDFYGGGIIYPGTDAAEVLTAFRKWWPTLPDASSPSISLLRPPDLEFVPEPLRGQFVVHLRFAHLGPTDEAERLLAPMRAVSTPIMDMAGPMNYADIDMVHMDPPDPLPYEEVGALLQDFSEDAQAALLEVAGPGVDCPALMIELRPLGGALARKPETVDAVGGRDAKLSLLSIGLMAPPVAALVPGYLRALLEAMRPYGTGFTLVNFHGKPGDAADRARAWAPEIFDRLRAAKASYDPANMFRYGHGIV